MKCRTLYFGRDPVRVPVVSRVKDAAGAVCRECDAIFTIADSVPWGWRKSQHLHERGTGHRMDMFAFPGGRP